MDISVRDSEKIVEIWLTNIEKHDTAFKESLKPLYKLFKSKKYLVAVFESGRGDLFDNTLGLLLYNRARLAEKE